MDIHHNQTVDILPNPLMDIHHNLTVDILPNPSMDIHHNQTVDILPNNPPTDTMANKGLLVNNLQTMDTTDSIALDIQASRLPKVLRDRAKPLQTVDTMDHLMVNENIL